MQQLLELDPRRGTNSVQCYPCVRDTRQLIGKSWLTSVSVLAFSYILGQRAPYKHRAKFKENTAMGACVCVWGGGGSSGLYYFSNEHVVLTAGSFFCLHSSSFHQSCAPHYWLGVAFESSFPLIFSVWALSTLPPVSPDLTNTRLERDPRKYWQPVVSFCVTALACP